MNSLGANPLLQNDPLLILLIQRWRLTPIGFGIVGLISLPALLLIYCAISGTLKISPTKNNPTGHGLLSPINAYLIILPFLDYKIFSYYNAYAREIPKLFQTGSLLPSPVIFRFFQSALAKWLSIGVIIAFVLLAIYAARWPKGKVPPATTWLCKAGQPRFLSYYFFLCFFGLHVSILFNWLIRHVAIWRGLTGALNTANNVYNPDKMFGLGGLGDLIWNSYGVMLTVTALVVVWLIGAQLTYRKTFLRHPGETAAVIVLLLAGPLGVLMPLLGAHHQMSEAQKEEETALVFKMKTLSQEIRVAASVSPPNDSDLTQKVAVLNAQTQLYKFVDECSTWPISGSMASALLGFLNPILVLLLKKFIPGIPDG